MAFVLRRAFSTTARRLYYQAMKPTIATPAPVGAGAVLESPDLQQLAQKAQGPWKELTNQEVVERKLYLVCLLIYHKLHFVLCARILEELSLQLANVLINAHLHTPTHSYSVQSLFSGYVQGDQARPRRLQDCDPCPPCHGGIWCMASRLSQKNR